MSSSASFLLTLPPPSVESGPTQTPSPVRPDRARDFRELARKLSPPSLRAYWGDRLLGVFGLMMDVRMEAAVHATLARSLFSPLFAPDALPLIGNERGLFRYMGETALDYRMRLHDAWRIWRDAGTEALLAEQLALVGVGWIEVLRDDQLDYDGKVDGSRVFIVLHELDFQVRSEGTWGDGQIWGDGGTWGSNLSVERVLELRRIVRTFKPAHVRVQHILIVFDDADLPDANGNWDDPEQRPANVLFLDG